MHTGSATPKTRSQRNSGHDTRELFASESIALQHACPMRAEFPHDAFPDVDARPTGDWCWCLCWLYSSQSRRSVLDMACSNQLCLTFLACRDYGEVADIEGAVVCYEIPCSPAQQVVETGDFAVVHSSKILRDGLGLALRSTNGLLS